MCIEASTKSGKTAGCIVWLLANAYSQTTRPREMWWVAPILPQASIARRRILDMLRRADPKGTTWRENKSDNSVTITPTQTTLWFKGSDNPDSLYGEDVHAAVIDEASRCKEDAWNAIRSTLTATRGPVRIIGNVRGRRNWAYRLARMAEAGEPDMAYYKLTAGDAVAGGVISQQEVEDARRKLPDSVFRELYLAEPSDDTGNPFGISAINACVGQMSTAEPFVFGVDLAKSHDYTVVCGLDADGCVCVLDRWQSDWAQTRQRVARIIGTTPAYVDSTGVGDPITEDLQRLGGSVTSFKFTSQSKQQIMEGLASAIQQAIVRYPDGWLRAELESFEYVYRPTGVSYSAPEGMHDDGVCALALAQYARSRTCAVDIVFV